MNIFLQVNTGKKLLIYAAAEYKRKGCRDKIVMSYDRSTLPEITDDVKRTWQSQRQDRSAGGIAFRLMTSDLSVPVSRGQREQIRLALIATHGCTRWQLPKGTCETGESPLQTAIREVHEETGLDTREEVFLKAVEYWYWDTYNRKIPQLVQKQVDFYLLSMTGGELSDSSHEVDAVGWFTPRQALERLTFETEKDVLQLALLRLVA